MLTLYADASFRSGVAGLGLVCTTFEPWIVEGRVVGAETNVDAEVAAIEWAFKWTDGLPARVVTDCTGAMVAARRMYLDKAPSKIVQIPRNSHPAHALADQISRRVRKGGLVTCQRATKLEDLPIVPGVGRKKLVADVERVEAPKRLVSLGYVLVEHGNGTRASALLYEDDGVWATVALMKKGKKSGRFKMRGTLSRVPSAWLVRA